MHGMVADKLGNSEIIPFVGPERSRPVPMQTNTPGRDFIDESNRLV